MAERLKDMFFTSDFIRDLGKALKDAYPAFDKEKFDHLIFSEDWENMELKQRMHHCTQCLVATLPEDYPEALGILEKVGPQFKGFDAMIFPDFVEKQGLEHWDLSSDAPCIVAYDRGDIVRSLPPDTDLPDDSFCRV